MYASTNNGRKCCLSSGQLHRNCKYDRTNELECKQKCNDDPECKGFFMAILYGTCQLSTISDCTGGRGPYWQNAVGPIDDNPPENCTKSSSGLSCNKKQTQGCID